MEPRILISRLFVPSDSLYIQKTCRNFSRIARMLSSSRQCSLPSIPPPVNVIETSNPVKDFPNSEGFICGKKYGRLLSSFAYHSVTHQEAFSAVASGPCRRIHEQSAELEVSIEKLSGENKGIVVISMNRPARKNAIGKMFLSQLQDALEEAESDPLTRVILLRSLVAGVFCAGADLKERHEQTASQVQRFVQKLRGTYADLEGLPIPSIAVVEGKALGGGCELALACDLRVADEKAEFGLPETGLAIIPGAGATQRLPRIIGKAVAKELIFTGLPVDAHKAASIGLVNHTVAAGQAYEKAMELARRILTRGPIAIRMAKTAIDRGIETDVSTGLAIEEACYAQLLPTTDRVEALQAFKEKRAPAFKGE